MISTISSLKMTPSARPGTSPGKLDVSIILNTHREATFLSRTLDSFDEAARYAGEYGIGCELIVVQDRPDAATRDFFQTRDLSAYASHADTDSIGRADIALLPHLAEKYATLRDCVETDMRRDIAAAPGRRLLWASRPDAQQRPDLLPLIAEALRRRADDIAIDVWTARSQNAFDPAQFANHGNLAWCGDFDRFSELPLDRYDLFLCTAAVEGSPRVVLEAMAAGLPVIATDVGSVSETLGPDAGVLIDAALPDEMAAEAFAAAISACYDDVGSFERLRKGAGAMIAARHEPLHFNAAAAALFRLDAVVARRDAPPKDGRRGVKRRNLVGGDAR